MQSRVRLAITAAAVAAGTALFTPTPGLAANRLSHSRPTAASACRQRPTWRIACGVVIHFFRSIDKRQYSRACSMLGPALLRDTGGPQCPRLLAEAGVRRYAIHGASSHRNGTGVRVSIWLPELDHFRELRWLAVVASEAGKLRIVETLRVPSFRTGNHRPSAGHGRRARPRPHRA